MVMVEMVWSGDGGMGTQSPHYGIPSFHGGYGNGRQWWYYPLSYSRLSLTMVAIAMALVMVGYGKSRYGSFGYGGNGSNGGDIL